MRLLFGVPEDIVILECVPDCVKVVKIRLRNDDFATVFIKYKDRIDRNIIEIKDNTDGSETYHIGPCVGCNQR